MVLKERIERSHAFRVGTSSGLKPKYSLSGKLDAVVKNAAPGAGPPDVKGPPYDIWGCEVFSVMEFISPTYSIDEVFSYPDYWDGAMVKEHNGYKPLPSDRNVPSASRTTSSIVRNTLKLITGDWNFFSGGLDESVRENPVFHTTYKGRCYSHVPESAWHRTPTRSGPYGTQALQVLPSYDAEDGLLRLDAYPNSWKWSYGYSPPEFWAHSSDFHGTLSPFEAVIYYASKNTYHYVTFERDMSDPLERITKIRYSYTNWYFPVGSIEYETTYDVEVEPLFERLPFTLVMGSPFWLNQVIWSGVRFVYTFQSSRKRDNSLPSPTWVPWNSGFQSIDYRSTPWHTWMVHDFSSQSGFDDVKQTTIESTTVSGDQWSLIRDFSSRVTPKLPDMWASTFYAAEDAYQIFMAAIETNNLENLSQLSSITDLIEPIQGFRSLVRMVRYGANPVQLTLSILDVLASAKLTWEYGIAPTISDAREIAAKTRPIYDRISSNDYFKPQTFNGKFTYEVPDTYIASLSGLTIVSRAKIRGNLNPHSYLAAILPLHAFGLVPSLAHLWDLLPFSFVVDWFVNVGRRLEDVDSSVEMLCLDTNYVTLSMNVHYPIPQAHLDVGGVIPYTSEEIFPPSLSTYVRTVQKDVPVLTYSTLDFRSAGGVPDMGTALSLIFKLIK